MVVHQARTSLIDFSIATDPNYEDTWFHESLAAILEASVTKVEKGEDVRIILTVPPRHGKSELTTKKFPAWVLGHHPEWPIIVTSYSTELATDFGQATRDIMQSPAYQSIFKTRLRADAKAKGKWITEEGGGYVAAGAGGAMTGKGFKCFPAGTMIATDSGYIPIEHCKYGMRVLTWNHESNKTEYKRILATAKQIKKGFTEITTSSGNRIKSTKDHPIFISGKGYVQAKDIRKNERVWILKDEHTSNSYLFPLQEKILKGLVRIYQRIEARQKRFLLWQAVFGKTSLIQTPKNVQAVSCSTNGDKDSVLLQAVPKREILQIANNSLRLLWNRVQTAILPNKILLNELQEQLPLKGYEGKRKSKLCPRQRSRTISKNLQTHQEINHPERLWEMCRLWLMRQFGSTSQGHEQGKQYRFEPGNGVQKMPHNAPFVQDQPVSNIKFIDETEVVFDIQVEDNHNFFANGILVHNCGIIDDPFKNREEAESQTIRDSRWNMYRSTFYTRQEGATAIVVIATRWHTDDLTGRLLKKQREDEANNEKHYDQWTVIDFPAIATKDEQFRKKGDPLWPAKFSLDKLETIKNSVGPYEWSALYQCNPITSENQEFKEYWFKTRSWAEVEVLKTRKFATIDPGGKNEENDNTGVIRNYVDQQNNWNIKAMGVHIDAKEIINLIFRLNDEGFEKIGIEETVFTKAIQPFFNDECKKRNSFPNLVPIKQPTIQKEVRIRSLIPRYASGSIFHIDGECSDLVEELIVFPKGARDDVVDALAMQNEIAEAPVNEYAIAINRYQRQQRAASIAKNYGLG